MDDMAAVFALMAKGRQLDLRRSASDIRHAQNARRREWQKAKQALAKALAAKKKRGFWSKLASKCGKLAKYAAVAAAVAAAVGTGGAAAPVVILAWTGAGLSAAACVQGEAHVLQKLGVSDKWAERVEVGMTVGAAVASGAACGWQIAESGEAAASGAEKTARVFGAVSSGVSGASSAAGGYATWQAGLADGEALDAEAEAVAARGADAQLELMLLQLLNDLEDNEKSAERSAAALRGAMETKGDTLAMISKRV